MYTPLEFVEQVKRYIVVYGENSDVNEEVNQKCLSLLETFMQEDNNWDEFLHDYIFYLDRIYRIGKLPKVIVHKWQELPSMLSKASGVIYSDTLGDMFNHIIMSNTVNEWKYTKYAYRVDSYLGEMLAGMTPCREVPLKDLVKIPTRCFYIDVSSFGSKVICEDLEGVFVLSEIYNNSFLLCFISLVRGTNGRLIPIYTKLALNLDDDDTIDNTFVVMDTLLNSFTITSEDGKTRNYKEKTMVNFYINFLLYLTASNKDVEREVIGKKREISSKPKEMQNKTKNKYKEIQMYNVGYRIVKESKNKFYSKSNNSGKTGGKKSPHFRSAHWHHYWVGSGDNKELKIKWVEGTFVNGKKEDGIVVVHDIK